MSIFAKKKPGASLRLPGAVCALVAGMAAPAEAEFRFPLDGGGQIRLYGQINPAHAAVDDGTQTYRALADNAASNTRLGLTLTQPQGALTFGFRLETALGLPLTSEYDQNGASRVRGWKKSDIRHVDLSVRGAWGKLSFGQGSMAADGAANIATSAVGAVLYQFTADANGLYRFRTPNGALSLVTVSSVFADFDGSRRGRLRYDSPDFNGFSIAMAHGRNVLSDQRTDDWFTDIALRYQSPLPNGITLTTAVAYQLRSRSSAENTSSVVASGTAMLPNGLSLSAGLGLQKDQRPGRSDPGWIYGQIAYDQNLFAMGKTSIGLDYYRGRDFLSDGAQSTAMGLGLLQKIDAANAEAYLTYRIHAYETPTIRYRDINSWLIGLRVRF